MAMTNKELLNKIKEKMGTPKPGKECEWFYNMLYWELYEQNLDAPVLFPPFFEFFNIKNRSGRQVYVRYRDVIRFAVETTFPGFLKNFEAARIIQKIWRGKIVRNKIRRNKASIKIQKIWRGCYCRSKIFNPYTEIGKRRLFIHFNNI
jgi:hypothetical protein